MTKDELNQLIEEAENDLHATTSLIDAAYHSGRLLVLESIVLDGDLAETRAFLDGMSDVLVEELDEL